ncbi:hypothetical protein AWW67_16010 [Roseivirga seohaensis]|uniref:Uncharacterized protein n=2 Tax=Roseivirga seohaensis TaxID=1914963 RepID=A0A0L8AHL5_9BACT|nr:hypothetical protein OB69_15450 [Roseivirga seohaensis subsp. aquiponti]KYG85215.1 hypothetical protein AWW67_16010 [Roseivirga seohaensis]
MFWLKGLPDGKPFFYAKTRLSMLDCCRGWLLYNWLFFLFIGSDFVLSVGLEFKAKDFILKKDVFNRTFNEFIFSVLSRKMVICNSLIYRV